MASEVSNILAIIPARGGSKSIPHKNIVQVAGKPLLAYSCEAVRACRHSMRSILDTDDPVIAEVGHAWGVETPFLRPPELAQDDTLIVDVLIHALNWLSQYERYSPEVLVLLQPTSPLRRAEHIDAAIDKLLATEADTVVSVVAVPHQFTPNSLMQLEEGRLLPYLDSPVILRRQEKPRFFARNGPAVLVTRRQVVEQHRLYGDTVLPIEMSGAESVDVDNVDDLALAEFWLNRHGANKGTI